MAEDLTFYAWRRAPLLDLAGAPEGGRLRGSLPLHLADSAGGADDGEAAFLLRGPGDVAGLKPGAIRLVAPRPAIHDAETTKLVHVDFTEPDLPWRYTPRPLLGDRIRPWLVVLVGVSEALQVASGVVTSVEPTVLAAHRLELSHRWAHVQDDGQSTLGRLLSPAVLLPQRDYTAAIVPAFDPQGEDAWTDQGVSAGFAGGLPVYYSWQFATGEAGDFETLASALQIRQAGDLGKARLHYRRPDVTGIDVTLEARGAITSLQVPLDEANLAVLDDTEVLGLLHSYRQRLGDLDPEGLTPAEQRVKLAEVQVQVRAELAAARADLDLLSADVADPPALDGTPPRDLLGLPQYGRPWAPEPEETVWGNTLNDDPRFRVGAGLGAWMAIQAQEELAAAAVQQAGAINPVTQRVGHLALGLLAARSLWQRHLPADPAGQLQVFGPAMGRMLATDGGTVLDRVTGATSTLDAALFSSAAYRLLRNGTARARHTARGQIDRAALLAAANEGSPRPQTPPAGLPDADTIADRVGERPLSETFGLDQWRSEFWELVEKFEGQSLEVELIIEISEAMASIGLDCRDQTRAFLVQARNRGVRFIDRTLLVAAIQHCLAQDRVHQIEPDLTNFLAGVVAPRPLDDRRPVNLERLAAAVAAVIDPRQSRPPACRQVASTIVGFDACALHPPEVPLGLDFPTWTLLNQYAKEWLLPGSGQIEPDSIVALQTNPTFIDSFMVGINSQFLAELRWRALPVDRTITPLRMFWGQVNYATQKRQADITPLRDWAAQPAGDLGDLSHQVIKPGDLTGKRDLVIAFKTALFRRYPSTIVYLVKAPEGGEDALLKQTPLLTHEPTPDGRTNRNFFGPIFHGALDPDLHFFAFDVDPGKLDEYWLVLDEPPSELRFRNDLPDADDSANYARRKIDTPTRVAISGAELELLGEQ